MKIYSLLPFVLCIFFSQSTLANLPKLDKITSLAKAELTDKILSKEEVMQGADRTQIMYISCLAETSEQLKMMSSEINQEISQDIIYDIVSATCEYPEDLFSIYNILLAASDKGQPMSEKQASEYLEKAYKTRGREKTNGELRMKIFKKLQTIE